MGRGNHEGGPCVVGVMSLGRIVDGMIAEPTGPRARVAASAPPSDAPAIVAPYVSFDALYEVEYAPMIRLAAIMLGDREQAADVVHDSFAKVFERWERLDRPGGYLRTAVVNGCRDRRRRALIRGRTVLPRRVDAQLGADDMLELLDQLPGKRRDALVLRFYLDLSEADIAEALGVRPGTVKSLVSRGLAQLAELLGVDEANGATTTEGGPR